ncbi:MAG: hypothetical protein IJ779_11540 [Ruminococcus sp.]|nr:hypothetical protein [Ruminococcus sp.]
MKNKLLKQTVAAVLSLAFLGSAAPVNFQGGLLNGHVMTASAEGDEQTYTVSYNEETKELVLGGILPYFANSIKGLNEEAESVRFEAGTVLPEDSQSVKKPIVERRGRRSLQNNLRRVAEL